MSFTIYANLSMKVSLKMYKVIFKLFVKMVSFLQKVIEYKEKLGEMKFNLLLKYPELEDKIDKLHFDIEEYGGPFIIDIKYDSVKLKLGKEDDDLDCIFEFDYNIKLNVEETNINFKKHLDKNFKICLSDDMKNNLKVNFTISCWLCSD